MGRILHIAGAFALGLATLVALGAITATWAVVFLPLGLTLWCVSSLV